MTDALNYDALANRRLDAKIESYDVITAITQGGINRHLKKLYEADESLKKLEIKSKKGKVTMSASMGVPKIMLRLGTNNKMAIFSLPLSDGSFEWYNENEGELEQTTIKDWVIAFDVGLELQKVEDSSISERIVSAFRDYGVGQAGNYSVDELLIKFTSADLSNPNHKHSVLPTLTDDASGEPEEKAAQQIAFKNYLETYLNGIKLSTEGSKTAISFIPKFTTPTKFPTLPIQPTATKFQNYPFMVNIGDSFEENLVPDHGEFNTLLYLQMTDSRPLPGFALNTSGPWVVPRADNQLVDGCLALSRRVFLDEWLIPKLAGLNKMTDITAKLAEFTTGLQATYDFGWSRSEQPGLDYDFKFKEIKDGELVFTFDHPSEVINGGTKTQAIVENWVKIPLAPTDGECRIKVGGWSKASVEIKAMVNYMHHWGEATWSAGFKIISGANNSGLEVVLDSPIPTQPAVATDKKTGIIGEFGVTGKDPKEAIEAVLSAYETPLVLGDMSNVFKGTWPYLFGTGGEYCYENPIFNKEGTLMLDLHYKDL